MRLLLERRPGLDAVFAASDVMAAGALQVLRRAGRRVPDDVAVVGFDGSIVAQHTDPPLTTVNQRIQEVGRVMTRILLDEIAEPGMTSQQRLLETELVRRESA